MDTMPSDEPLWPAPDPFAWVSLGLGWQQSLAQALLAWQRASLANAQEVYDEWLCRFGGGVPFDG